jgi:hypothetical protein
MASFVFIKVIITLVIDVRCWMQRQSTAGILAGKYCVTISIRSGYQSSRCYINHRGVVSRKFGSRLSPSHGLHALLYLFIYLHFPDKRGESCSSAIWLLPATVSAISGRGETAICYLLMSEALKCSCSNNDLKKNNYCFNILIDILFIILH